MTARAFISYSHVDEAYLERLHKHLSVLMREGLLETWTDHAINPGAALDQSVMEALGSAQFFIALVSPDYLASNYCYEKEFAEAQRLSDQGQLHIVPVIIEPCDWLNSPFRKIMALPKDGKPISEWTNANVAFLDVVTGLRRLISSQKASGVRPAASAFGTSAHARRIKIKQEFDSIQRQDFADQSYADIGEYFERSCSELDGIEDLKARFTKMTDTAFTCTVVNRAIKGGREAHITVHNGKGRSHSLGEISYVFQPHAGMNTSNGSIRVEADDYNMFLVMGFGFRSSEDAKLDAAQAAENLWTEFIGHADIQYE